MQLLGAGLVVVGFLLAIPNIRDMLQFRRQGRRPSTILITYFDMVAGIEVVLLGLLFLFDNLLTSPSWRPYVLFTRLLLIGAIWMAGFQRFREANRHRKARNEIRVVQSQIDSEGESADLLNNLGYYYREIGELDKAKEILERALSIDSNMVLIHLNLGNTYLDLGLPQQALAEYKKAKALEPHDQRIDGNIELVLKTFKQK